jgi:tetratricopeptide (TPR) repeat protein
MPELESKIDKLCEAGRFAEAAKLEEDIVRIRARIYGPQHWYAADARRKQETLRQIAAQGLEVQREMVRLAQLMSKADELHRQARYREAQPLYQEVLAIRRTNLGEEHVETASSYESLADNLTEQGKYDQAQCLLEKALGIYLKAVGEEHPRTANTYNNLASCLYRQSKYEQAEPQFEKALSINRKAYGE